MEIQAGGRVWDVETKVAHPIAGGGEDFCGITFRDRSDGEGQVAIGWVPRSRLTTHAALRLFELAGDRLWRDPRTGVIHRVVLEDGAEDLPGGPLIVRFMTAAGVGSTAYDLPVPLGMAGDEALQRLLERSLRRGPGRLGGD